MRNHLSISIQNTAVPLGITIISLAMFWTTVSVSKIWEIIPDSLLLNQTMFYSCEPPADLFGVSVEVLLRRNTARNEIQS